MKRLILLMILILCSSIRAQDDFAAPLEVIFPGVEVQRVNTEAWFSLPQDAVAILGVGDTLRTDADGRAYLTFGGDFTMLILPDTTYTLETYSASTIAASLDGQAVHSSAAFDLDYTLSFNGVTITEPADTFAIWTNFESMPVVIPSAGKLTLDVDGETVEVDEGQAFYRREGAPQVVEAPDPANAARLIGRELGCTGTVDILQDRLNLRAGTGLGFLEVGFIEDGGEVQLMGINETRSWLRVQRFSGFGWVQSLAIHHDCPDLPVYPNITGESNLDLFSVTPLELSLLIPFYGTPDEDRWFYRSLRDE